MSRGIGYPPMPRDLPPPPDKGMSDDLPAVLAPRHPRHKTLVVLSRDVWVWLRTQAQDRALREGGRPNVSLEIERLAREARGR